MQWTAHCTVAKGRGQLPAATLHRVHGWDRHKQLGPNERSSKASKDDFFSGQPAIVLTEASLILVVVE